MDSASLHLRRLRAAQGDSRKKHKQMDRLLRKGDLYLQKDVENAMDNFVTLQFNRKFVVFPGLEITFVPAGHLLGAAHVLISVTEKGETKTIGFSGDIGRANYPLHIDPQPFPEVDYLVCETTYGNRNPCRGQHCHPPHDVFEHELRSSYRGRCHWITIFSCSS